MPHRALAVALLALVSACAAPPPPFSDPRVTLVPDAGVQAGQLIVTEGPPLRAVLTLLNPTGTDRAVLQTTDWTTDSGLTVRTLLSRPQRLTVPRYGDATIQIIAPTPDSSRFHIRVEPDFSAN